MLGLRSRQYWVADASLSETAYRVSGGGDLDLAARDGLSEALARALDSGATTVELDFTDVAFIDSTAIKVIAQAAARIREAGGKLEVTVGNPNVLRIFAIAGVDRLFEVTFALPTFESPEELA